MLQRPILLWEWQPRMDLSLDNISRVSVWLKLQELPCEFWSMRMGGCFLWSEMDVNGDFPMVVLLEDESGI